jgi:hypothetical protein
VAGKIGLGLKRGILVPVDSAHSPLRRAKAAAGKRWRLCAVAIVIPVHRANAADNCNASARFLILTPLNIVHQFGADVIPWYNAYNSVAGASFTPIPLSDPN